MDLQSHQWGLKAVVFYQASTAGILHWAAVSTNRSYSRFIPGQMHIN